MNETSVKLRLAWWNTDLSPPGKPASVNRSSRWKLAAAIVKELLEDIRVDVLALGEATSTDTDRLMSVLVDRERFGRLFSPRRNMVILYDSQKLSIGGEQIEITRRESGKEISVGTYISLVTTEMPVHLIAVHWPSRKTEDHRRIRRDCGTQLKQWIAEKFVIATGHPSVVIIGDFNDEPFDDSLFHGLRATRDRAAARKRPELLYNPFWRVLGEHQPLETGLSRGAGTHFYTKNQATSWYTIDQALVSSALLQGDGWTLLEDGTDVLPMGKLLTANGTMRLDFDHLPIIVSMEYRAIEGQS